MKNCRAGVDIVWFIRMDDESGLKHVENHECYKLLSVVTTDYRCLLNDPRPERMRSSQQLSSQASSALRMLGGSVIDLCVGMGACSLGSHNETFHCENH